MLERETSIKDLKPGDLFKMYYSELFFVISSSERTGVWNGLLGDDRRDVMKVLVLDRDGNVVERCEWESASVELITISL